MTNCPICSSPLEMIVAAPCFDCGHAPSEALACALGEREYHVFEVRGQETVLCEPCAAVFGLPEFWGLPDDPRLYYPLHRVRGIDEPRVEPDLYCPSCQHRLAFLTIKAVPEVQ